LIIGIIVFIGCLLLACLGIVLSTVNFPGGWLIAIATLLYGLWENFICFSVSAVVVYFIIAFLSTFLDNIVMLLGAKKMGGSKWGMLGAFLGGIIGLISAGPLGIIIGPFIGAVLCESVCAQKEWKSSLKAGLGAFMGFIIGVAMRVGISMAMVIYWVISVWKCAL
jgi:uncharacterized protein